MSRLVALWLALALAWPSPAVALRPRAGGLEERTAVTEELSQQLTPTSRASGLEEEWGEAVWNRLYDIRKLHVPVATEQLQRITMHSSKMRRDRRQRAWERIADQLSETSPETSQATRTFAERQVVLHELHGNLLWDRQRREGVLLVGGSGLGKSTLSRMLTDPLPVGRIPRWQFLADDFLVAFIVDSELVVGSHPVAFIVDSELVVGSHPVRRVSELKHGLQAGRTREGTQRFVKVQRLVWLHREQPSPIDVVKEVAGTLSSPWPAILSPLRSLQRLGQIIPIVVPENANRTVPEDINWAWYQQHAVPRIAGGVEEVRLAEPTPLAGNLAVGQVIPVTVENGDRWAQGRAVVLDPQRVIIQQFVNPDVKKPAWPGSAIRTLPPEQQPGLRLADMIANPPRSWGSAPDFPGTPLSPVLAMNGLQMNFWEDAAFLVVNGYPVSTTRGRWAEAPWVFVLDAEQPGLRQLPLEGGRPVADGIREAIPGPVLVRDSHDVSAEIRQYPEGQPNPNQVRWDPTTTHAAFSALGKTADQQLIWLALGGRDDPRGAGRASVQDVAQAMLKLGAVEAILLGGSMDVQQWLPADGATPGVLGRHIQPPHNAERRLNSAILVYASARQPDETFVQQVQGFSRTLRAMVREVYPAYGAPEFIGIAGVRNPQAPRWGGGIPEDLLPAMTSLDAAAFIYAPVGRVSGARGEVGQAENALRDFLREEQRQGATSPEFRQRVEAFADTLDLFWRQSRERPPQRVSPDAGLEEMVPQPTAGALAAWLDRLSPGDGPAFRLYGTLKELPEPERREMVETVAKAYRVFGRHFQRTARYLVRTRGQGTAEIKADGSPVLPQDRTIQRRFNQLAPRTIPGMTILGEEGSVLNPMARWWVTRDPLDGTRNYKPIRPGEPPVAYPSHYLSTMTLCYRLDDGRMIPVLTIAVAPEYMDGQPLWLVTGLGIDGVLINGQPPVRAISTPSLATLVAGVTHIPRSETVNQWYLPAMHAHARQVVEYPDTMAMWEIPLSIMVNPNLPGTLAIRSAPVWDTLPTWHLTEALGGAVLEIESGQRFHPTHELLAPGQAAVTPALVYAVSERAAREIVALGRAAGASTPLSTGLEERADPGDPAVQPPDPATATAADVADYLTRRWGVPVRPRRHDYVVDQGTIPEASWTFHALVKPEPGRIVEHATAMPVKTLMYPPTVFPGFSKSSSGAAGVYLGLVEGIRHPVVIKELWRSGAQSLLLPVEIIDAQIFGHQGIAPRVYGIVQFKNKVGYVMQVVPGVTTLDVSSNVSGFSVISERTEEAGFTPASLVRTPSAHVVTIDADEATVFDGDMRARWITAQNAGWAIHELRVVRGAPTGQAYLLSNEAVPAALALLKVLDGTPLPVIAVVDPARRERLRAIAKQGGFSDAAITVWEQRYLVITASNDRAGMQAAMLNATARLAARLGRTDIQPIPVYDLPKAPGAFRDELLKLLSGFGLTIEPETLPDEAIQDLYRAAQA